MSDTNYTFDTIYSSSKNIYEQNKNEIYKFAIILSFFSLLITIVGKFDLFFQLGTLNLTAVDPMLEMNFKSSTYALILNFLLVLIKGLLNISIIVYFFNKIIGINKTLIESINYTVKKTIPIILTTFVYFIFIVPLFILLIVPGIIFSILWVFYIYVVLFRNKNYYSALKYSKQIVSKNKTNVFTFPIILFFKLWKFWIIPLIVGIIFAFIFGILSLFLPEVISSIIEIIIEFILEIFFTIISIYSIIFMSYFFLNLEQNKGISNELSNQNEIKENNNLQTINGLKDNGNEFSQNELNAKKYIEDYKSQYPRDSIKTALLNTGLKNTDVENYLNKYF